MYFSENSPRFNKYISVQYDEPNIFHSHAATHGNNAAAAAQNFNNMAVGQKTNNRHCYLSIVDGAVVQKTADGGRKCYSFVEGKIDAIYPRLYTFDGEEVGRWCIDMHDYTESYTLSFSLSSGPFISIVLALANDETLTCNTLVRIAPYTSKKGYTKVRVFTNGSDKKLMWVTDDIPPKKKTIQNGRVVVDDSEQTEFITKYVSLLHERMSIRERSFLIGALSLFQRQPQPYMRQSKREE